MDDSNFFQAFGIFCCVIIVILLSCSSLAHYMRRQNLIRKLAKIYSTRLVKNVTSTISQKTAEKITGDDVIQAIRKAAFETRDLSTDDITDDEIAEAVEQAVEQAMSEIENNIREIINDKDAKATILSVLDQGQQYIEEIKNTLAEVPKPSKVNEGFINATPQCYSRGCSNNYPFGIGISDDCIGQPIGSPIHIRLDTKGNAATYSYKPPSAHGIYGCAQTACPKKLDCMGTVSCWDCCNYN